MNRVPGIDGDCGGDDSRLACQIRMRAQLDGVVVFVPQAQH